MDARRRLLGVVNAFDIPTRQAFVVEMVERHDAMNAIAFNGARVVGPALASVLVASIGEGWCRRWCRTCCAVA